jgi:hypothetical protein
MASIQLFFRVQTPLTQACSEIPLSESVSNRLRFKTFKSSALQFAPLDRGLMNRLASRENRLSDTSLCHSLIVVGF